MCSRRDNGVGDKRQERETRQQEKKARDKKTYCKKDDSVGAFNNQLRTFNLQLRNITGDGNCLFRSFADQLDGDQHRHHYYRKQICDYMRENRQDFEPFIVDQPFDAFVRSLSKDGTYGGNECIVAFARRFDARICIHQLNQPVWTVCFSDSPKHEIHISYHNYEHYSSVRRIGDRTHDSANIRQAMTTCDPDLINEKKKNQGACALEPTELFSEHDVEYIYSQLTNPVDRQLIRDTLNDNHGDIDGAIAYLLALETCETPEPVSTNESTEISDEHDVEHIHSQLKNPVDRQVIRDTLKNNQGDVDATITHLLAIDIPLTPQPVITDEANESIERIMATTGIYDVELVQQTFAKNNCDMQATIEAFLKLTTTDDNEKDEEFSDEEPSQTTTVTQKTAAKNRPGSSRQTKIDKKKAKKQRATEKHRAQILASSANSKTSSKTTEEKANPPPPNNEEEPAGPANMEFIRI